jgi:type II secretory pathway pseudopilin PulG
MVKNAMKRTKIGATGARSRGFSLLEMLVAFGILMIVIAVAVKGMIMMQTRSFAETSKVDAIQQTRDFVDQMVRDVHDVGYPPGRVKNLNPTCVNNAAVSCGLIMFSPTAIQYEGDLDGSGTVYQVWMQLEIPPSGKCPCTLQRGVVTKTQALAGISPTYFTEVNGVLNSGDGLGAPTYPVALPGNGTYDAYATADVFDAYDVNGDRYANPVSGTYSCNSVTDCSSIRSLQISANVAPNFMDQTTKVFAVYSITSKARLNN